MKLMFKSICFFVFFLKSYLVSLFCFQKYKVRWSSFGWIFSWFKDLPYLAFSSEYFTVLAAECQILSQLLSDPSSKVLWRENANLSEPQYPLRQSTTKQAMCSIEISSGGLLWSVPINTWMCLSKALGKSCQYYTSQHCCCIHQYKHLRPPTSKWPVHSARE